MKKKPYKPEFWLNLGYSYSEIGEYQAAIDSYMRGIKIAPERADGYLSCANAYMHMQDFEQALKACDVGIEFAGQHNSESWAAMLTRELEEAKSRIDKEYAKSKYGTFSS